MRKNRYSRIADALFAVTMEWAYAERNLRLQFVSFETVDEAYTIYERVCSALEVEPNEWEKLDNAVWKYRDCDKDNKNDVEAHILHVCYEIAHTF